MANSARISVISKTSRPFHSTMAIYSAEKFNAVEFIGISGNVLFRLGEGEGGGAAASFQCFWKIDDIHTVAIF